MQRRNITLHFLTGSRGNNGTALIVNKEHEVIGPLFGVLEILHKDIGDIGHQVDGVIPYRRRPRLIRLRVEVPFDVRERRGRCHDLIVTCAGGGT